ncbi:lytic transglycosylase domain-containing protein [Pseudomonas sp. UL073]|uniref:Lytic transglycosylase domain-containing protein n=1 Tax=Zestomonas insulae TaxID=2809017 RepID=A0ABS2I7T0_9GAMM|nr:lytic transglycosylase domain-containing protein [Pseudomonas insulae]MBM7059206.1 lytic transglycosylase domain-containing protein [Pseudomonas insulae]
MRIIATLWTSALVIVLGGNAAPAQADVYMGVAKDGSIVLSNIYRAERNYVRVRREAPVAAAPAPVAQPAALAGTQPYEQLIAAAATAHDLPPALLHAVISVESGYDPRAQSPQGAAGLMQLMPATARELGVSDVWDPAANVDGGARYLKRMLELFGNDLSLALAAYNAGPGAVRDSGRSIPPIPETMRYVPNVLEHYRRLVASRATPAL